MEDDSFICSVYYDIDYPQVFDTCKNFLAGIEVYMLSQVIINVPDLGNLMVTHRFNLVTLAMAPEVQSLLIEFLEPYEHIWINQDPPQISDYVSSFQI